MVQLYQDRDKFEENKIKVVVICPENMEGITKFVSKNRVSFDLVSDENHILADKYGQKVVLMKLGRMPAQIVLDKNEDIIFKHYSNSMKDIVENDELLKAI